MDFDAILRITGRICPFVVLTLAIVNLNAMFANIEVVLPNYLYPPVDHWCSTPALEHLPQQQQRYISIPYDANHENYETCSAYDLDWDNYTDAELAAWNWTGVDTGPLPRTGCVSGWTYDNSTFQSTATSEWNLVCGKAWIHDMLSPVYMAGLFVGSMISGPMSDSQGRLRTMLLFVVVSLASGIGTTLAVNEWMFMLFRFTLAIGHRISGISSVIIGMEIIAPQYRSHTVVISRLFLASGSLVATCAAYFLRDFRVLQFSMVTLLVLLFILFFLIPESPRWLMAKGRRAEAKAAVLKLARGARATIPDHLLDKVVSQEAMASGQPKPPSSAKDLFKTPTLVRWVIVIGVIKLASQFVYFGVTMNMDRMFGNIYLNIMLASMMEIPAILLIMGVMHCLGNKTTAFIMFCLTATGGIVAMSLQVLEVASMSTTVTLLLVRCAASGSVVTTMAMSGELFPSAMRQTAVSLTSAIASVVTIFAPFVGGPIQSVWEPLPSVVFSVMSIAAAGLILLLPDTRGKAMPETIEDSLNIARSSKKTVKTPAKGNKPLQNGENGPTSVHFQNGFNLTDKSAGNGAVTSPSHAGVQVGAQFYPAEVHADESVFDNWAFQDEFDLRL